MSSSRLLLGNNFTGMAGSKERKDVYVNPAPIPSGFGILPAPISVSILSFLAGTMSFAS